MQPEEASVAFENHLRKLGLTLQDLSPSESLDSMIAFYRDTRAEACVLDAEGDMLLFQWGTYDWGHGRHFEFDVTRQFIVGSGEDDDISQLSLTVPVHARAAPYGRGVGGQVVQLAIGARGVGFLRAEHERVPVGRESTGWRRGTGLRRRVDSRRAGVFREMRNSLLIAAGLATLLAAAHSYLGERYILIRLLRRDNLPKLLGGVEFTKQTLRFAWHITSIAWLGLAALLFVMSSAPGGAQQRMQARVIAAVFGLSGLVALLGSRGRHLSWIVFLAIAALVWGSGS